MAARLSSPRMVDISSLALKVVAIRVAFRAPFTRALNSLFNPGLTRFAS